MVARTEGENGHSTLDVTAKEWLMIASGFGGSRSETLPAAHPSLARAWAELDKRGSIVKRSTDLSPRIAKTTTFLMPTFPRGGLRKGKTWSEPVQWVDVSGDFKVKWQGQLHWTLVGQKEYGGADCAHLTYQADVLPQLWAGPSWIGRGIRRARYQGSKPQGEVFFDSDSGRVLFNSYAQEGVFRIPLANVNTIPDDVRIGRPVEGAGELIVEVKQRINLRRP
jgi:hypothetical protein